MIKPSRIHLWKLLMLCGLIGIALSSHAENLSSTSLPLRVKDAHQPLGIAGVSARSGYFSLENKGTTLFELVKVSSPAYGMVMMHKSVQKDGMDNMVMLKHLIIKPGHSVHFSPGGLHLMLLKPKWDLKQGDTYPVTLYFSNGKTLSFTMPVVSNS